MKKNLIYIVIALVTIVQTSCSPHEMAANLLWWFVKVDEPEITTYTISGYLYDNANNMTPLVNHPVYIYDFGATSSTEYVVFTDNNGYFKLKIKDGGGYAADVYSYCLKDIDKFKGIDDRFQNSRIFYRSFLIENKKPLDDIVVYMDDEKQLCTDIYSLTENLMVIRTNIPMVVQYNAGEKDSIWISKIDIGKQKELLYSMPKSLMGYCVDVPSGILTQGYYLIEISRQVDPYTEGSRIMKFQQIIEIDEDDLN